MIRTISFCLLLCLLLPSIGCGSKPLLDSAEERLDAARIALESGDNAKAMDELTASIEVGPSKWAYYYRAKLHSDTGDEKAALADCEAGLALVSDDYPDWASEAGADQSSDEDRYLIWLQTELKKPAGRRFKGKNAAPPTESK